MTMKRSIYFFFYFINIYSPGAGQDGMGVGQNFMPDEIFLSLFPPAKLKTKIYELCFYTFLMI